MRERPQAADRAGARRLLSGLPHPIVLWRLHRAEEDLLCVAIETPVGYALKLVLETELHVWHVEPPYERLITDAGHIERALRADGWRVIGPERSSHGHC